MTEGNHQKEERISITRIRYMKRTDTITFHLEMDKAYYINLKSAEHCMTLLIPLN